MSRNISLNGSEVASYVKERHVGQVRSLGRPPTLAIVTNSTNPSVETYLRVKQSYADDVGIAVTIIRCSADEVGRRIDELNEDNETDAIIVQLPFDRLTEPDVVLKKIAPKKDVDALGDGIYPPATATAIFWLLASYNIDLNGKNIVVVGHGRLVGKPVAETLQGMGLTYTVIDEHTQDPESILSDADIVISGVGKPEIIKSNWLKAGSIVVDAGVASEAGELKGDVEASARERTDISITPVKGGVGPLTVAALFDNVLKAAR